MPVYNAGEYLREAVESILSQTFGDFELIIINDASPDGSAAVMAAYAQQDTRVHIFTHDSNRGLPTALNTGLRNARGKYIARMDQDDIAVPDRLEAQYVFLEEHADIAVLGGGYAPFNERGQRAEIFHPTSSIELAWRFVSDSYFCHPTVMFRREIVEKVGNYPNVGAEDFAFFSKIIRQYRCANLRKILVAYREHATNFSLVKKNSILDSARETYRQNCEAYGLDSREAAAYFIFRARNTIAAKDFFSLLRVSCRIIGRARAQYRMSRLHPQYVRLALLLPLWHLRALVHTLYDHRSH